MSFTNPSMLANSALISDKSISPKIPPPRPAEVMKAEKLLLEEMDEVLDRSSEVAPDLYLAKMLIVTERERTSCGVAHDVKFVQKGGPRRHLLTFHEKLGPLLPLYLRLGRGDWRPDQSPINRWSDIIVKVINAHWLDHDQQQMILIVSMDFDHFDDCIRSSIDLWSI